jgi:hypothetical protein
MELLRNGEAYPNLRPAEIEGKSPDEIARAAIDHAKSNLEFLYNNIDPEVREQGPLWYEGARLYRERRRRGAIVVQRLVLSPVTIEGLVNLGWLREDDRGDREPGRRRTRRFCQMGAYTHMIARRFRLPFGRSSFARASRRPLAKCPNGDWAGGDRKAEVVPDPPSGVPPTPLSRVIAEAGEGVTHACKNFCEKMQ